MSHWTKMKTTMKNKEALVAALKKMYPEHEIVENTQCRGYMGNKEKCEIVVKGMTGAYDIGYKLKDGTYEQVADWYGIHWTSKKETESLGQYYASARLKTVAESLGKYYDEVEQSNGDIVVEISGF